MIGAIAGDIIGSRFEWDRIKSKDFELFARNCDFTDDSVLTIAVADALMNGGDYAEYLRKYTLAYRGRGYGDSFYRWALFHESGPYGSFGNGSAMRVGAVGWMSNDMRTVLAEAERTAVVTHSHPEGIKGAQAVAAAIFMARNGIDKAGMGRMISGQFGYDLDRKLDTIRETYGFNETCQRTVPEALLCFLEATSYEDTVRNAVSLGGDSDTLACIAGSVAEAYYGVPTAIREQALSHLAPELVTVVERFERAYHPAHALQV
mgnify:CR=1 FL=1